jgi:2,3-bisphosphoglycerate-independent phosphoglycerate mutase
MVKNAAAAGVRKVRLHILLDGRDVPETSALEYVDPFEEFLAGINKEYDADYAIASGGGRMVITMDRYGANWKMVELGWKTHVLGEGDFYGSAHEAIEDLRKKTGAIDQDLPAFVISRDGKTPLGTIEDGDAVRPPRIVFLSIGFSK